MGAAAQFLDDVLPVVGLAFEVKFFEGVDEGQADKAAVVRSPNPVLDELDIPTFHLAEIVTGALAEASGGGDFVDGALDLLLVVLETEPFCG